MKKFFLFLILIFFGLSAASAQSGDFLKPVVGMTQEQLSIVMKKNAKIVGAVLVDRLSKEKSAKWGVIVPPGTGEAYIERTEIWQGVGKNLMVLYYISDYVNDSSIKNEKLVPFIFDSDRLLGWGKNFLNMYVTQNGLKLTSVEKGIYGDL